MNIELFETTNVYTVEKDNNFYSVIEHTNFNTDYTEWSVIDEEGSDVAEELKDQIISKIVESL